MYSLLLSAGASERKQKALIGYEKMPILSNLVGAYSNGLTAITKYVHILGELPLLELRRRRVKFGILKSAFIGVICEYHVYNQI